MSSHVEQMNSYGIYSAFRMQYKRVCNLFLILNILANPIKPILKLWKIFLNT